MKQLSACPSHRTAWHLILTLAAIMFACPTTTAENIFVEGTTWTYDIWQCGGPNFEVSYTLEKIDDQSGRECLGVFSDDISSPENRELQMIISTEGKKVLVLDESTNTGEDPWKLLYDFGMNPGDKGEFVIYGLMNAQRLPDIWKENITVECMEIREPTSDTHYLGDAKQMIIRQYSTDMKSHCDIVWTKGFGTNKGICLNLHNGYFTTEEWKNPILKKVSNGDDVYYQFNFWEENPDNPIRVETVPADTAGISIEGRTVTATAPMTIHSIDGRTVASGVMVATVATPGVYIVSSGTTRTKIAVR